jgi:predicted dehydrogenase
VLGKAADIVTLDQGLATVAVAEACIQSAATGSTVSIA